MLVALGACNPSQGGVGAPVDLAGSDGGTLDLSTDDIGEALDFTVGDLGHVLDVQPASTQVITVAIGASSPTVTFSATLDGAPIACAWSLDRGDVGAIGAGPSVTGVFTPKGTGGGVVTVSAGLNGQTVKRQVLVQLTGSQNGANAAIPSEANQIPSSTGQLTQGGGVGGVGGEGLGGAVDDPTKMALGNPAGNGSAQGLTLLYPYDATVWPRGLPAPLLMWSWSTADADAIQIRLRTTSGSFDWTGTFGRPAILAQTGGAFIRHPIPQDVWDMATNTAGGKTPGGATDQLTVYLTVAKGGVGYGPIQQTWTIAPARLSGIIYYNSYGTKLAQNYTGALGGNGQFGGAVLSIHVGDSAPQLAAGANGGTAQCRVCHSVAAFGASLIAQHGDAYRTSSSYAITAAGISETTMATGATFPGIFPDGTMALSPSAQLLALPAGTAIASTGLAATNLGTPAFSPDGKLVAFNPMAGLGTTQQLYVSSFDKMTNTFSNAVLVSDDAGQPAQSRPGWPAFLPDGKSLVFHHQTVAGYDGNGSGALNTRGGSHAQIWWTRAADATHVTALDKLNGKGYLPKLPAPSSLACSADGHAVGGIDGDHADDVDLNYEPTVNPIASGGYAWVVFTSRRMYGNEATIPPFCSDPRGVDLTVNITTKKLWVAAIDLTAQPGADASHPAFYLPAQELLAGNARGFWVLDPCRPDGASCMTGDQCCGGYCEPNGAGGALICSNQPPNAMCSNIGDKCATAANCCDPTNLCVDGFCSAGIN